MNERSEAFSGGCLCGAVRYRCSAEPMVAGHCFCADCRRTSGTANCSHLIVPGASVSIEGQTTAFEKTAESGAVVARHFCPTCGSAVFSTNSAMPEMRTLRASSLDDPEIFRAEMVVYTSRAPSWAAWPSELPSYAELPEGGPKQVLAERGGD